MVSWDRQNDVPHLAKLARKRSRRVLHTGTCFLQIFVSNPQHNERSFHYSAELYLQAQFSFAEGHLHQYIIHIKYCSGQKCSPLDATLGHFSTFCHSAEKTPESRRERERLRRPGPEASSLGNRVQGYRITKPFDVQCHNGSGGHLWQYLRLNQHHLGG